MGLRQLRPGPGRIALGGASSDSRCFAHPPSFEAAAGPELPVETAPRVSIGLYAR